MRPVFVSGVVGNREIPKPTVGSAARLDNEVQCATSDEVRRSTMIKRERVYHLLVLLSKSKIFY